MNKKKVVLIIFVLIIVVFFMMAFAGEPVENAAIATRQVIFTDGFDERDITKFQVEVGESAAVPEVPVHENYVFMGWYEFANQKVKVSSFNTILDDMHVVALYDKDINNNGIGDSEDTYFNVSFVNSINNEVIKTERVLIGMNASAPEAPNISNYTFGGWDKNYTNVRENLIVSAVYNSNSSNSDSRPRIIRHTVTFIDGYDNSVIDKVTVNDGLSAGAPTPRVHEKKLFIKWDGTYTNVKSDQTVTAIYGDDKNENDVLDEYEPKYMVKFESNGRGHLNSENDKYEYDGLLRGLTLEENGVVIPEIVPDKYYKSSGWLLNNEVVQIDNESILNGDATYSIIFSPINDNNGDNNESDGIADEEQVYTLTINYIYESDGSEAHASYVETKSYYDENGRYNLNYYIVSPTIKGYSPDKLILEGKIDSNHSLNKEITVKYRLNKYTITWNNYDGSLIEQDFGVDYGTMPSYDSAEPVKVGNDEYSYVFVGWTPELRMVSNHMTYTAKFNEVKNKYTIKFINEDGSELQTSEVEYGVMPSYEGETPTKTSTDENTYTFAGWDKEIEVVTKDEVYVATYTNE